MIRALVWEESVTIPACEPVSEIALWPMSWIAIAQSAQEIRSPVESSMSISRASGRSEISCAISTSSSVVLPRAESTATTRLPCLARGDDPPRGALDSSAPATEVPPNFITTMSPVAAIVATEDKDNQGRVRDPRAGCACSACDATHTRTFHRDISSRYMELSPTAYVILGMLGWRPMSGYEIKSLVDKSTRFFWAASYGQIYPELRRLAEAGLIEGKASPQGGRKRTVYRLTAGRPQASCAPGSTADREVFELRDEGS